MESRRSRSAYGFFTFHLPPSTWFGRQTSVLRVLLGIGCGQLASYSTKISGWPITVLKYFPLFLSIFLILPGFFQPQCPSNSRGSGLRMHPHRHFQHLYETNTRLVQNFLIHPFLLRKIFRLNTEIPSHFVQLIFLPNKMLFFVFLHTYTRSV